MDKTIGMRVKPQTIIYTKLKRRKLKTQMFRKERWKFQTHKKGRCLIKSWLFNLLQRLEKTKRGDDLPPIEDKENTQTTSISTDGSCKNTASFDVRYF